MKYDKFGVAVAEVDELCDLLYINPDAKVEQIFVNKPDQFNNAVDKLFAGFAKLKRYNSTELSVDEFDAKLQSNWHMPDSYKTLDIEGYLVDQCPEKNYLRLVEELKEYNKRNMLDLLRWLKYFVDVMRSNNLPWGVGRGSSVASYVLYLLGVHKIDSVKYKLDIKEFLR